MKRSFWFLTTKSKPKIEFCNDKIKLFRLLTNLISIQLSKTWQDQTVYYIHFINLQTIDEVYQQSHQIKRQNVEK